MHRCHVDAVESSSLLSQLVYDGLGLAYVTGSAHLGERQGTEPPVSTGLATSDFRLLERLLGVAWLTENRAHTCQPQGPPPWPSP